MMKPLMRLLKQTRKLTLLRAATKTFVACCRSPVSFSTTKAGLKVITQPLLVHYDKEILNNACWALFLLLDGMSFEEVNAVINVGFIKPLLKFLSRKDCIDAQLPALESVHLISLAGPKCIQGKSPRHPFILANLFVLLCK